MKERIKSLILVLLLVNAIILSIGVWSEKRVDSGERASLDISFSDIIRPSKTIISSSQALILKYGNFEPSLYDYIKEAFLVGKFVEVRGKTDRYVKFIFSSPINTYLLLESLGAKNSAVSEEIPKTSLIAIYIGDNITLSLEDENLKLGTKIDPKMAEDFLKALEMVEGGKSDYYYNAKESLSLSNDLYFPYEINRNFPIFSLRNEVREMDILERRSFAEDFLKVRYGNLQEIIREDNSSLYISGNEVLTILPIGEIKYFNPITSPIRNSNVKEAFESSLLFLEQRIDLRNLNLSQIREIKIEDNLGYEFSFDYCIGGIPVIYRNSPALRVEVYGNHIRAIDYMMRRESVELFEEGMGKDIKPSFDILEDNFEIFEKLFIEQSEIEKATTEEVMNAIEDIRLSYYDAMFKERDSEIIPVWIFYTDFGTFGFDAVNGQLVIKEGS